MAGGEMVVPGPGRKAIQIGVDVQVDGAVWSAPLRAGPVLIGLAGPVLIGLVGLVAHG
jgi:hypothetical protein